jgi:hypothetical protein
MPKRGRVYVNQSVSFPPGLLTAARERASRLGLTFSAYVQKCLEKDLQERGSLVLTERTYSVPPAKLPIAAEGTHAHSPAKARRDS